MTDNKLQQNKQLQTESEDKQQKKQSSDLLKEYGGFNAVMGIIPDAADMNPRDKAAKTIFLTEEQYKNKRKRLANELAGWLNILKEEKNSVTEYADLCDQKKDEYQELLKENIKTATEKIKRLEISYRNLDAFFKNAGIDKITNIRFFNAEKFDEENKDSKELASSDSDSVKEIKDIIHRAFDRLSLKENYSILVMPGFIFKDKQIRDLWAEIAFEHRILLVTDHADCNKYEDMFEQTENYKDTDMKLQNVIVTANWLVGRNAEALAEERNPLYIPPSGALAGKLYNPNIPISQGAAGEKYGTLSEIKGVHVDMLKTEITSLWDNKIIPMVFSEGRVMAFNNTNLYNGDLTAMRDYPIVRVFDWVKKNLVHYVHKIAMENWDPYNSPDKLKETIQSFLNDYKGYGKLFEDYTIGDPIQDEKTKEIKIDINLKPFFAAKNFTIQLSSKNKKTDQVN
ncbi:MAG: DUF5458 family protein [Bacteroidales bacterium]|jgi:hypothetical protein|nr:DUF5458 family protein [Bacteroidales bacterium]